MSVCVCVCVCVCGPSDGISVLSSSGPTMSFLTTSACTTMIIAVERCLCVLFPLKAQTLMSTRTMVVLLLTITLLLQLGFTIFLFKWAVRKIVNSHTGQATWMLVPAQAFNQDLISVVFQYVFNLFLMFIINMVTVSVVVVCTVATVVKLKLALMWRLTTSTSGSSETQTQQTALSKMLVVVCCIYVICSTPSCIMALARRIEPEYSVNGRYANFLILSHDAFYQLFSATNSSVNFFVFYNMSFKFRKELRRLCHGKEDTDRKGYCELTHYKA